MKHPIFNFIINVIKIYFSDISHKDCEYKKLVFNTLKSMGGVYIKFLQTLCVMDKFTTGWAGPREFEMFNKVSKENIDINKYIESKDAFSYIETTPFACGSFAQLYKAKLKSGEVVAIKVLRPSVVNSLQKELKKLQKLVKIINFALPNTIIDYKESFAKFSQTCLLETDYESEIYNMKYFGDLYKNHPYVVVPKVYEKLCNKQVIVQEFIEGPTLADLISKVKQGKTLESLVYELTGSNVWSQITVIGGEALRTSMVADYVFGDPHPGNIILLKNNKVALVDFGIVSNKPVSQEAFYLWTKSYYDLLNGKVEYGKLLQTTCMCFCPDLMNALDKCSLNDSFLSLVTDAFDKKIKVVNRNNQTALSLAENGHVFKLLTEFVDSKNALNLKFDTRNFQLLKAIQSFLCSVTTIDNRFGNSYFKPIMTASMEYAFSSLEEGQIKHDFSNTTKYSVNESYELLMEMLSSLADGDEFLFRNISERMFL